MSNNKCHLRKNDKVKVLTGKDKGKIGKVIRVLHKKSRVLVENVNIAKRHTRPNSTQRQGGIIESEAPIHWSNVVLLCNKCVKPTRTKINTLEDNKKVRVCVKCNEIIDG